MPRKRLEEIALRVLARRGQARTSLPAALADLDSIARIELILAVEAEFGIEFAEEEIAGIATIEALDAAIEGHGHASAPPAPQPPMHAAFAPGGADDLPRSPFHRPARVLIAGWTRLWCRLSVTGVSNLPEAGSCFLVANHASHLDSLVLLTAARARRHDLIFPAARDYFFSRRRFAQLARHVLPLLPFEREGATGELLGNLRLLSACRDAARIIVLFPEGTRSSSGELLPFKEGLSFFAGQLQVPVVPCWIDGTHRALPRGAWLPRPGRLRVAFGPPVSPQADGRVPTAGIRQAMLALRDSLP